MEILIPEWSSMPGNVGAFVTLRRGGCSLPPYDDGNGGGGLNLGDHVGDLPQHVEQNRKMLGSLLPSAPVWLSQVHGTTVVNAAAAHQVPQADASISSTPGVVCAILTADCLPVLFCDRSGKVVGAAHAGWRGLAAGVLENTVAVMRAAGAAEIMAWLGPAIGPQQFEVGQEVRDAFVSHNPQSQSAFQPVAGHAGKYLADIYQLARIRLRSIDVTAISGGGACTVTDKSRFYSYRRDKITGRMASLIWIK